MKRLAVEFRDQRINMSLPETGVLMACVSVIDNGNTQPVSTDSVQLELDGLDSTDGRHPSWGRFNLVCGESVVITVHDDRVTDPALFRLGETEAEKAEAKRRYVRRTAAELGWTIVEP